MNQPQRQQDRRDPSMGPTKPATLVVIAMVTAALGWILVANYYRDVPKIPWLPAFVLFALAIGEAVLARTTKARIDRRPGTAPVDALAVARYVVLAKASSPAGATFVGLYGGLLVALLLEQGQTTAAASDVPPTAASLVASLALVLAALYLERACRVPKRPEDDKSPE
jgi:hypothetical protein